MTELIAPPTRTLQLRLFQGVGTGDPATEGFVGPSRPTIFLYDGHPGGVGISRRGYDVFERLVADASRLIAECPCANGCPSCVQSPECGNLNEPLHKSGALELMDRMITAIGVRAAVSKRRLQIAVVGTGAPDEALEDLAQDVGRRLAEAGAVLVCGGLGGVMEAAARGARTAGGDVIGILPGAEPGDANPHCTHVVAAATGKARNLAVVASADAVVAVGGAWGTLSEIAHARALGRAVVALRSWTVKAATPMPGGEGIEVVADAAGAVNSALALAAAAS